MFQVGLPCYLGLNSARQFQSTSTKRGSLKFQKHSWCMHASSMFPTYSHMGNIVSRSKLCLCYTAGNFNKNPSMQAVAKILRTRASEHSSNFCEQFEQTPNFASAFKLEGTIRYSSFTTAHIPITHIWEYLSPVPGGFIPVLIFVPFYTDPGVY